MLKNNRLLNDIEFLEVLVGKDLKQVNGGTSCINIFLRKLFEREVFYIPGKYRIPPNEGNPGKFDSNGNQLW